MASEEWERDRRERRRQEQGEKLARAERVEVTEDNISVLAKRTGHSEHKLMQAYSEAASKGARIYIRIPSE